MSFTFPSYTPPAPAAVPPSVLNAIALGCDPSGQKDCSAILASALVAELPVYFPPGHYRFNDTCFMPINTQIDIRGEPGQTNFDMHGGAGLELNYLGATTNNDVYISGIRFNNLATVVQSTNCITFQNNVFTQGDQNYQFSRCEFWNTGSAQTLVSLSNMTDTMFIDCTFQLTFPGDIAIYATNAWINASINHCTFTQGGGNGTGLFLAGGGNGVQGLRITDSVFLGLQNGIYNDGNFDQFYLVNCILDYCAQDIFHASAGTGASGLLAVACYFGVQGTGPNDCALNTQAPLTAQFIGCSFADYESGANFFYDTSGAAHILLRDTLTGIVPSTKFDLAAGSTWEQSSISEHVASTVPFTAGSGITSEGNFISTQSGGFTSITPAAGTWYQNTSGGLLLVSVTAEIGTNGFASLTVNSTNAAGGSVVAQFSNANTGNEITSLQGLVPNGFWYYVATTGSVTLTPSGYPSTSMRIL